MTQNSRINPLSHGPLHPPSSHSPRSVWTYRKEQHLQCKDDSDLNQGREMTIVATASSYFYQTFTFLKRNNKKDQIFIQLYGTIVYGNMYRIVELAYRQIWAKYVDIQKSLSGACERRTRCRELTISRHYSVMEKRVGLAKKYPKATRWGGGGAARGGGDIGGGASRKTESLRN